MPRQFSEDQCRASNAIAVVRLGFPPMRLPRPERRGRMLAAAWRVPSERICGSRSRELAFRVHVVMGCIPTFALDLSQPFYGNIR